MSPSIHRSERGTVLARRPSGRPPRGFIAPLEDGEDEGSGCSADYLSLSGTDQTPGTDADGSQDWPSSPTWELDMPEQRSRKYDEFANQQLNPEETALMIKKFEKAADIPFSRTYHMGKAVRGFPRATHTPHVGLVFMPGANLPEVNRLEQAGMVTQFPDQRDAAWRVNTAGSLLENISVAPDLSLTIENVTSLVAKNAHRRLERATGSADRALQSVSRDAVTIDSEKVEVVHDFGNARNRELDLSATLIEVNVSSLFSLMYDYKQIVLNSGDNMTFEKTKALLDRMIEAARRFCIRSPILFRMSTRTRIIRSNNTHYGVDSEHKFTTFTSSKGIQEIIMMSASYYNSLDPSAPGMDSNTQKFIRPRFLQMLTLLLSLLNNYDLKAMAEFLERTYGIIPPRSENTLPPYTDPIIQRRADLEVLFLKVIPLTSINSKVFLQNLVPAVDQWSVPEKALANEPLVWADFLKRLARKGYLLPGTVEDLGHGEGSWITQWPTDGVHSSTVFSRLQYHGEISRSFNEIPTARFSFEPEVKELTVIMTNNETYTIDSADYEQISTLTKGVYSVTKCDDNAICEMEINESLINGNINEAIRIINDAIRVFNSRSGPAPGQRRNKFVSALMSRNGEPLTFPNIESASRLTRNQVMLNGDRLAVAYKLNGRNVPKTEAIRYMSSSFTRATTLFGRICNAVGQRNLVYYEQYIGQINSYLVNDRKAKHSEIAQAVISDAPIAQTLGHDDADIPSAKIWYKYNVSLAQDPHSGSDLLQIQADVKFVASVNWRRAGQQADITLADMSTTFFVAPLKPVTEAQQDEEVCVGDLALLVGRYIVIASPQDPNDYRYPYIMTNWLEIQDASSEDSSRRRRNLTVIRCEDLPVTTFL